MRKLLSLAGILALTLLAVCGCATLTTATALAGGSAESPIATPSQADLQPWENWRLDSEGYPPDRRLLHAVSMESGIVTVAELLHRATEQTGVHLTTVDPQLAGCKLTVAVKDLPLQAVMVQLAELLGTYWYQRPADTGLEYAVTYGSGPPSVRAAEARAARSPESQQRRASRIAEFVHALSLTQEELQALGRTDPYLVGTLTKNPVVPELVRALSQFSPASLRRLVETGKLTVDISEVTPWYGEQLRVLYARPDFARSFRSLGIDSEEALLRSFRLVLKDSERVLSPADGDNYDISGPVWTGIRWSCCLAPPSASPGDESRWQVVTVGGRAFGTLPGKMEDPERIKVLYPNLAGVETTAPREERLDELIRKSQERQKALARESPWKHDAQLSRKPEFALAPQERTSNLLQAVAKQTGYAVLAAYYPDHDTLLANSLSTDQPTYRVKDVIPAGEPLYMLLNRAAIAGNCTWKLRGRIIIWRHNDWFLYETEHVDGAG